MLGKTSLDISSTPVNEGRNTKYMICNKGFTFEHKDDL